MTKLEERFQVGHSTLALLQKLWLRQDFQRKKHKKKLITGEAFIVKGLSQFGVFRTCISIKALNRLRPRWFINPDL
ncbi:hypothetical protein P5673_033187 [Acropora cervicornis]|uniref:Uncharacterized protein n=1 Tax=Acropora cervicornis TaxID=6130 RepID=A0AAD9URA4_ACRCE|nr:hypothetical protein P5673_033187 [Acropora cervicornis]